ncbi:hypothetical protein [Novosphingobium sp. TCA1]|nr:hypothetical protein [Novosphingobium sp. TCA1]GFE73706.1 hypothetical protein NTCA1_13550 [Novosphingobium sp. TCA1]
MKGSGFLALCLATALALPHEAMAQAPSDLADLVGSRAAGGEQALESRGYVHINSTKGDDRTWSNWWKSSSKRCVTVATMDGRFNAITSTLPADCNQKASGGSNTGAIVAGAAAVALLGALALSHKSHDHDDGKHYDDDRDGVYERGYRDGLYAQSYHNYDKSDAYSQGYEAGVRQRGRETSYRDHDRRGAGYSPSVNVSDLEGARGSSADDEMQRRGFANVDGLKSGNTAYTIWYNRQTRQCLQMGVADGRVANIADIGSSPKCR